MSTVGKIMGFQILHGRDKRHRAHGAVGRRDRGRIEAGNKSFEKLITDDRNDHRKRDRAS